MIKTIKKEELIVITINNKNKNESIIGDLINQLQWVIKEAKDRDSVKKELSELISFSQNKRNNDNDTTTGQELFELLLFLNSFTINCFKVIDELNKKNPEKRFDWLQLFDVGANFVFKTHYFFLTKETSELIRTTFCVLPELGTESFYFLSLHFELSEDKGEESKRTIMNELLENDPQGVALLTRIKKDGVINEELLWSFIDKEFLVPFVDKLIRETQHYSSIAQLRLLLNTAV